MMNRLDLALVFIFFASTICQLVTSSVIVNGNEELEDELKRLPTESAGTDIISSTVSSYLKPDFDVKQTDSIEQTEDDDDDSEEEEEETGEQTIVVSDGEADDDDEMDTRLQSMGSQVLDEELELEKRMTRATAKFLSSGKLDESTVEELVEVLIRFAGDPEQWEKIRQILEKIRYEQITTKKAKARLRALATLNQHHRNQSDRVPTISEAENGVHVFPKPRHHLMKNLKQNKTPMKSINKNKAAAKLKQLKFRKVSDEAVKSSVANVEPYKYAVETPVTVVGERSKPKAHFLAADSFSPIGQSLKAIQMQKSRLLSSARHPTDAMEEELQSLVEKERRLKQHFQRKQKLLQQIRENNLAAMENGRDGEGCTS